MANYKYKLSELAKKASADDAEKELGIPKSRFKVGQVSFSSDGTSKSTITDIDPETGAVKWEITQLPGFDKLYDDLTDLVSTAKRTYVKTKDDKKFREFYDEIRVIRNKVRTHLRNEYPDQYKRITRIGESELNEMIDLVHVMEPDGSLYGTGQVVGVENDKTIVRFDGETVKRFPSNRVVPVQEEEVDEVSLSNAAGAYLTPYAFRKKGQKPNDEVYKELGFEPVKEGDTYEKMAAKGKKAGNLKQGTVRKRLNIPKGEKIPLSKINKEISRIKKMENPSEKNKKYLKALNLAKTLKTTTNVNELNQSFSIGDELTLDDRKGKVVKVMDDMLNVDFGNGDVYGITLSRIKGDKIFKEAKDPGATLGPGPKAGPDGVDDNYYVKAFKYKLVPKKNGTYVQKGSGLEVKKLF